MTENPNALQALKNAWNGALEAADRLRALQPMLDGLEDFRGGGGSDYEAVQAATLANANAAQALRGLVEELHRLASRS